MYKLISTAIDSSEAAHELADYLVSHDISKCVQIVPGILSHYKWEGKKEVSSEYILLVKAQEKNLESAVSNIERLHSYDAPEIVVADFEIAGAAYRKWFDS